MSARHRHIWKALIPLIEGGLFFTLPVSALAQPLPQRPPQPPIAEAAPASEPRLALIGQSEEFSTDQHFDNRRRTKIRATHHFTGDHAYLFIEDEYLAALTGQDRENFLTAARSILTEFDQRIYPMVTQVFGKPWEPGIDNDPRLTILVTQLTEFTAGYFNPQDEFPRLQVPRSNEREMLYLNTRFLRSNRAKTFLAHEFQHLISFQQKELRLNVSDDVWLNETRSEYVSTLLGYDAVYPGSNLEHRVSTFLRNPNDALTEWANTAYDYGPVMLFAQYLADQFSVDVFREIMRSSAVGIPAVEEALRALGHPLAFPDLFTNWGIANYLNNRNVNAAYGYRNPQLANFRLPASEVPIAAATAKEISVAIKDWANNGFRLAPLGSGLLRIDLAFPNDVPFRLVIVEQTANNATVRVQDARRSLTTSISEFGNTVRTALLLPLVLNKQDSFGELEPSTGLLLRLALFPEATLAVQSLNVARRLPSSGGVTVTVTGSGFTSSTRVLVDNVSVTSVRVKTASELSFAAPAHAPGDVALRLENPAGEQFEIPRALTYAAAPADGSLIRARGDYRVYIVKGAFRRHIPDPGILSFYQHLNGAPIIEINSVELADWRESSWVRAESDPQVWEVNGDGTRHWLNMSAEQFAASGRHWDGVYLINERERDYYLRGADVLP